jgi:ferredoxin-NADP reductase
VTLLYGNRTPESMMFKEELQQLVQVMPNFKVIHIFSDLPEDHVWAGDRGFITKEIISREVDMRVAPTFFIIGPPIFISLMRQHLAELDVKEWQIKQEKVA